jgi:hypothetical protein
VHANALARSGGDLGAAALGFLRGISIRRSPVLQEAVLAQRRLLRADRARGTNQTWSLASSGDGFSAVDDVGRWVVGLARSGGAAEELLAALAEPAAPSRVRWMTTAPSPPTGRRLNIFDEPALGDTADFIAEREQQRENCGQRCLRSWRTGTAVTSGRRFASVHSGWIRRTRYAAALLMRLITREAFRRRAGIAGAAQAGIASPTRSRWLFGPGARHRAAATRRRRRNGRAGHDGLPLETAQMFRW